MHCFFLILIIDGKIFSKMQNFWELKPKFKENNTCQFFFFLLKNYFYLRIKIIPQKILNNFIF